MAIGRPIEQTPNIADKVVTATATAGQTQFTVDGGYRINHLAVFRNGVRLVNGNDYTALDGTTITLMEDASNLDVLEFQVFDTFNVSDALLTNAASQTVNGDVTVNGTFTVGSGGIGTFTAAEVVVGIVSSTTGITTVQSLQASSSTTTGALVVKGGVGIGKSLHVGGNISVGGTLTYEDVTNVDSVGLVTAGKGLRVTTGGLVVTAGVSTFAGITTVTNTAAFHSKQLNVSAGSTFGGAITASDTLTVAGNVDIADKIIHTGDTNTAIRFPAADTITAETGGSERLRITSAGLVGIGTNNPTEDLHIGSNSPYILLDDYDNARKWTIKGTAWFAIDDTTASAERLRIDSSGRVLIGTTTEGEADADNLTIADSGSCGITIRSGTSAAGAIYFSDATSGAAEYDGAVLYNQSSQYMDFYTAQSARLRIDSSGRILIGTTANRTVWGGNTAVQIEGLTGATSSQTIVRNSNDEYYPWLGFGKSRGTSDGASTIIQDDDCLGAISFNAADGNDMTSQGAAIYCDIDGTPGADDTPGRLEFHTCPDGSSTAVERLRIDSGGNLILGGTSAQASDAVTLRQDGEVTASGFYFANNIGSPMNSEGIRRPTTNTIAFDTASVERVRIGASGQVLIGHTAVIGHNGIDGYLQVTGTGTDSSSVNLNRFSADNWCPFLSFGKSRNATKGSHTIVQNNDYLAYINFAASDGVDFNNTAAFIAVKVDGTPGTDDTPGRIEFATCPDGTNAATTRTTIDNVGATLFSGITGNTDTRNTQGIVTKSPYGLSFNAYGSNGSRNWRIRPDDLNGWADLDFSCAPTDGASDWPDAATDTVLSLQGDTKDVVVANGNLKMGVAGKGINFHPQGGSDVNLLDDYEEGSWTAGVNDYSATYANQQGYYRKVGSLVFVTCILAGSGSPGSGNLIVTSLPFSSQNTTAYRSVASFFAWTGFVTGGLQIVGSMSENSNQVTILGINNNGNATTINRSGLNSSGWEFQMSITYCSA